MQLLDLPSGEMRMVPFNGRATIGEVGNGEHELIKSVRLDVSVIWVSDLQFVVLL